MDLLLQSLILLYFLFALNRLKLAALLLPLFFPAYLLSFTLKGIPFTLIEGFIDAVFLAFLFHLGREFFQRHKAGVPGHRWFQKQGLSLLHGLKKIPMLVWIALVLLIGGAIIGVLLVPKQMAFIDGRIFLSQRIALGILKGWIITPLFMFVVFLTLMKSSRDVLTLLNSYTGSCLFLAVWALWQVVSGDYETLDARASGPFTSANYLSLYITPAILYALVRSKQVWEGFRVKQKQFVIFVFFSLSFVCLFAALFFSKSYAAMLAFFLAASLYFGSELWSRYGKENLFKKISWKWILALGAVLAVFLVGLFYLDPQKWQLFFEFYQRTSSGVRIQIYTIATTLIFENPFFGIGPGQFEVVYQLNASRILGQAPYEWNMLHPHNLFLGFWLNLGLAGVCALLLIIYLCVSKVRPFFKSFALEKGMGLQKIRVLAFALFLIVLIHGLFDMHFFKNDLSLLFWMIVAAVLFLPATDEALKNRS
jgi:hypothetical protein